MFKNKDWKKTGKTLLRCKNEPKVWKLNYGILAFNKSINYE